MVGWLWAELLALGTTPLNTGDAFKFWYAVFWRQDHYFCTCVPTRALMWLIIPKIDPRAISRVFLASKIEKATLGRSAMMMHRAVLNHGLPPATGSEIKNYKSK
jgi:hypothetical protein